ncbi:MAG: hypothetical protein MI922_04340, partial [Bacteroidales bacterium]|nr:hypothetical protein [Bacteroidales bacterium]
MENGYKKIISFKVWHEYYTQLLCNDLVFEPTDECRQFLNGYNLVTKKIDGGFEILQAVSNDKPFIEIDELTKFHFAIHIKSAYFFNFTQNPITNNDQLIFLSNSEYTDQHIKPFPLDYSKFEKADFVNQFICDNDILCDTLNIHNLRYSKSNIGFLEICYNQVTPNNNDLH